LLVAAAVTTPLAALGQVGGLTSLLGGDGTGANVLRNGGFETRAGAGAEGWRDDPATGVWSLDGNAHGGGTSLRLSGAERSATIPASEQSVKLAPGFYTLEAWVRTERLAENDPGSGVRVCLDGRPRLPSWTCTDVIRGTRDWTRVTLRSLAVREAGAFKVTLGAYGKPGGAAWFDDVSLAPAARPALDVFLLYPNFRGMLFDDRSQTIRLAVRAGSEATGARRVRVSLVDEANGTVVRQRELPAAPSLVAEIDASGLAASRFVVRTELVGEGATRRGAEYRVVRVSAGARKRFNAWYDERNVTHLDGKPAFILGLYNTSGYSGSRQSYARGSDGWGNDRIAEAPINMLINYHLGRAPIDALRVYMDDLHAHGIHYLQTVNFYYRTDPQWKEIEYPAAKDGEEALNQWVAKTLGAHRALAGFYTADERSADAIPGVFAQRRALAEAAPGTVTYAVLGDGWESQAPLWRDAVDVLGLDPYPITHARGRNDLAQVAAWTRLGREAVMASRPLWMVLQFFPLTSEGGWPSYDDLETMSWMAIVEGAQGLIYWSFGERGLAWVKDPRERKAHWDDLVRVTKGIKALEPVLLAPDHEVVRAVSGDGAVRTLGKRTADGSRYLFAYNGGATPRAVTFTLAEPAREMVDLRSGNPGPAPSNGAVQISFGPYEVKRYLVR
jgi:hypothetical protein